MGITELFVPTAVGIAELADTPGYPHTVIPHSVGILSTPEVHQRADRVAATIEAMLLTAEAG